MIKNPKTIGSEDLNDKFEFLEEEDSGRRVLEIEGKEYLIVRKDPHGLWEFVSKQGVLPKEIQGRFTSPLFAEQAARAAFSRQSKVGSIARKHKEDLGPSFDTRGQDK